MHFTFYNLLIVLILIFNINHISAIGEFYISNANNTYYIEFDKKFRWVEGQIGCMKLNMTLVEIHTSEKSLELNTLIGDVLNTKCLEDVRLWTGGIMTRYPKNHFVWFSTGERFSYNDWFSGNPDFVNKKEFCVSLDMRYNFKWNDAPDSLEYGYICEYSKQHIIQQDQQHKIDKEKEIEKYYNLKLENLKHLREELQNEQNVYGELQKELEEISKKAQELEVNLQSKSKLNLQKVLKFQQDLEKQLNHDLQQLKLQRNLQSEITKTFDLHGKLEKQEQFWHQIINKYSAKEIAKQQEIQQDLIEQKSKFENVLKTEIPKWLNLKQNMPQQINLFPIFYIYQ